MSAMENVLFVPDVHGRPFWREAQDRVSEFDQIIFLGDYMDPYPEEDVPIMADFQALEEIVAFKQAYPEKVTLLLGNHDTHYALDLTPGDRFRPYRKRQFAAYFNKYMELFRLATVLNVDGVRCLVTHAGVHRDWYERHAEVIGELNAANINRAGFADPAILDEAGRIRYGYHPSGSILWADLREFDNMVPFEGIFQIFGHTRQKLGSKPVLKPGLAMIDIQRVVTLAETLV